MVRDVQLFIFGSPRYELSGLPPVLKGEYEHFELPEDGAWGGIPGAANPGFIDAHQSARECATFIRRDL